MRHVAARFLAVLVIPLLAIVACAHFNSPAGFVQCMENSKDEKAAEDLIFAMIDKDAVAAIDAAISAAPDVVKCLLQKAASLKSAGGAAGERAKKAQRYLDAHGLSSLAPAPGIKVPALASLSGDVEMNGWRWVGLVETFGIHEALPFERPNVRVYVTAPPRPCERGMHDFVAAPYRLGTVCVTDDVTFDVEVWRGDQSAKRHGAYYDDMRVNQLWVDGPPLTEI